MVLGVIVSFPLESERQTTTILGGGIYPSNIHARRTVNLYCAARIGILSKPERQIVFIFVVPRIYVTRNESMDGAGNGIDALAGGEGREIPVAYAGTDRNGQPNRGSVVMV